MICDICKSKGPGVHERRHPDEVMGMVDLCDECWIEELDRCCPVPPVKKSIDTWGEWLADLVTNVLGGGR